MKKKNDSGTIWWIDGWTNGWMDACMDGYVWMGGCCLFPWGNAARAHPHKLSRMVRSIQQYQAQDKQQETRFSIFLAVLSLYVAVCFSLQQYASTCIKLRVVNMRGYPTAGIRTFSWEIEARFSYYSNTPAVLRAVIWMDSGIEGTFSCYTAVLLLYYGLFSGWISCTYCRLLAAYNYRGAALHIRRMKLEELNEAQTPTHDKRVTHLSCNSSPPRARIRRDESDPSQGRRPLGPCLLDKIVVRAGEPRQIVQHLCLLFASYMWYHTYDINSIGGGLWWFGLM